MDTGHGRFEPLAPSIAEDLKRATGSEQVPHLFKIGQEVEVNGSRFKVHSIKKKRLILRLLPAREEPTP